MNPKVSIIIVSYNVKQLLFNCLKSLYELNKKVSFEVIIIDNQSADDSCQMIKANFPDVRLIENNFNAGFSGANNQGMEIAQGEYIFLLNPDTEFLDNSLEKLVRFAEANTDKVLIAPRLLNSDHSVQISVWKNHSYLDLIRETFYLHLGQGRLNYNLQDFENSFEVKTISGAAMFFHRKLLEKLKGLDENFFWMEDIDFSFRAQQEGIVYYYREAEIVHHSGQSQKKNYDKSIANQLISKLKYYHKYASTMQEIAAILSCFILILSRLVVFSILSSVKKIYRLKAKAYFYTWNKFFDYVFLRNKGIV